MHIAALVFLLSQDLPSRSLPCHAENTLAARLTPDGKLLVTTGLPDRTVKVWIAATGRLLYTLADQAETVELSADGAFAAVGGSAVTTVWNVASGNRLQTLETGKTDALGWSADAKSLATVSRAKAGVEVRVWDVAGAKVTQSFAIPLEARRYAVSPGGGAVAVTHSDLSVRLWSVADGKESAKLVGHTDRVSAMAFSPDGRVLATAAADQTVRFWKDGKEIRRLSEGYEKGPRIGWGRDGKAAVSADAGIEVWDLKAGRRQDVVYAGPGTGVWVPSCLEFSPDGRTLLSGGTLFLKDAPKEQRTTGPLLFWKLR